MKRIDPVDGFREYVRDRQPMYDYSIIGREDDEEMVEWFGELHMRYTCYGPENDMAN